MKFPLSLALIATTFVVSLPHFALAGSGSRKCNVKQVTQVWKTPNKAYDFGPDWADSSVNYRWESTRLCEGDSGCKPSSERSVGRVLMGYCIDGVDANWGGEGLSYCYETLKIEGTYGIDSLLKSNDLPGANRSGSGASSAVHRCGSVSC